MERTDEKKFNLLTHIFIVTSSLYTIFRLLYFLYYFKYCNRIFYSHLAFLAPLMMTCYV